MIELEKVLKNRRWERHDHPFPYVYAQGVFTDEFYQTLESEFNNIFKSGRFTRNMPGYDALGAGLTNYDTSNSIFVSPHWHDMLGNLFEVKGTGYVNAGFHHHAVGSDNGFVHNDLNPVWFSTAGDGYIRFPDFGRCNYKDGAGSLGPNEKIEVVRAVVMIFYLANGPWIDGDGGETGFYTEQNRRNVDKPSVRIPPYDNSLIVYECTPISYHSFIHNKRMPRNSFIMWTHRAMEDAVENFGDQKFERWSIADHPNNPERTK